MVKNVLSIQDIASLPFHFEEIQQTPLNLYSLQLIHRIIVKFVEFSLESDN